MLFLLSLLLSCAGVEVDRAPTAAARPPAPSGEPAVSEEAARWFLRAQVAHAHGDDEEAERSWKWALRHDRDSAVLWTHRASFLAEARRWEEALEAADEALSLDPHAAAAHLVAARVHLERQDDAEALPHLQSALNQAPGGDAAELAGRLHLRAGQVAAAEHVLDGWLTVPTLTTREALSRARLAREVRRHEVAVADLLRALDGGADLATAGAWLVSSCRASCQAGTALRWAAQSGLVERGPEGARLAMGVAELARSPGLMAEAILLVDAREVHHDTLSLLWEEAGELDKALVEATGAPRQADLLVRLGRPEEALLRLDASKPLERIGAAVTLHRLDRADEAAALVADDPMMAELVQQIVREQTQPEVVVADLLAGGHAAAAVRIADRLSVPLSADVLPALMEGEPHSAEVWLAAARLGLAPEEAARRALEADGCAGEAQLWLVSEQGCAALPGLEQGWTASPWSRALRVRLSEAYDACGVTSRERVWNREVL